MSKRKQFTTVAGTKAFHSNMYTMFYDELSQVGLTAAPNDAFRRICKAWSNCSSADWVWLWIHNRHTNEWELVSHFAEGLDDFPVPQSIFLGDDSVAELASTQQSPIHVSNLSDQALPKSSGGRQHDIKMKAWLQEHGCDSFITVPVASPVADSGDPEYLRIRAAICLHYKDSRRSSAFRTNSSDADLSTKGRLTAGVIANAYHSQRMSMLSELNGLATKFLCMNTKQPSVERNDYLREISLVIRRHLNVKGVSVFYRVPFQESIECIFSTGLQFYDGDQVHPSDISNARYDKNEGRTGRCFASGEPAFVPVDDDKKQKPKFIELNDKGQPTAGPALLWPIKSAGIDDRDADRVDGVLRITEHPSHLRLDDVRSFDPFEAATLEFVAQQIGPVLHSFSQKIQRETQTSFIKHDLAGLIAVIRDSTEQIEQHIQSNRQLPEYALSDLKAAQATAENIVGQLEPAPFPQQAPNFTRVMLLGDIVARNKAMLEHLGREMRGVAIKFDGFKDIPALWIDKNLIERAFFNLLMNAIKYSTRGTTVSVDSRESRRGFHVDISNYGIGVPFDDKERIFTPYYRSPVARSEATGAGLGLYIADVYMKAHGGTVDLLAANDPTIFSMFFPARLRFPRKEI